MEALSVSAGKPGVLSLLGAGKKSDESSPDGTFAELLLDPKSAKESGQPKLQNAGGFPLAAKLLFGITVGSEVVEGKPVAGPKPEAVEDLPIPTKPTKTDLAVDADEKLKKEAATAQPSVDLTVPVALPAAAGAQLPQTPIQVTQPSPDVQVVGQEIGVGSADGSPVVVSPSPSPDKSAMTALMGKLPLSAETVKGSVVVSETAELVAPALKDIGLKSDKSGIAAKPEGKTADDTGAPAPSPTSAKIDSAVSDVKPQTVTQQHFKIDAASGGSEALQTALQPTDARPVDPKIPAGLYTASRNVAEQVSEGIKKVTVKSEGRIVVNLNPADLGRVEITLKRGDGHHTASLIVDRPETLEMIRTESRWLERALAEGGMDVRPGALSIDLRGGRADQGQREEASQKAPFDAPRTFNELSAVRAPAQRMAAGRGINLNIKV